MSQRQVINRVAYTIIQAHNELEQALIEEYVQPTNNSAIGSSSSMPPSLRLQNQQQMGDIAGAAATASFFTDVNCGGNFRNSEKIRVIVDALQSSHRILNTDLMINTVLDITTNTCVGGIASGIPGEIVAKLLTPNTYNSQRQCKTCGGLPATPATPISAGSSVWNSVQQQQPYYPSSQQQATCKCNQSAMDALSNAIESQRLMDTDHTNILTKRMCDLESCLKNGSGLTQTPIIRSINEKIKEILKTKAVLSDFFVEEDSTAAINKSLVVSAKLGKFEDPATPSSQPQLQYQDSILANSYQFANSALSTLKMIVRDLFCVEMEALKSDYGSLTSENITIKPVTSEAANLLNRLEDTACCMGYMDRYKDSIQTLTKLCDALQNQEESKIVERIEKLKETIKFFEQLGKAQSEIDYNSSFHLTTATSSSFSVVVNEMNYNIEQSYRVLTNIVLFEMKYSHSPMQLVNHFMIHLDSLIMLFVKREVLWLRNLIKMAGNADIMSPKMALRNQPLRLFRFVFLAKMWPMAQVLTPDFEISNVVYVLESSCQLSAGGTMFLKNEIRERVQSLVSATHNHIALASNRLIIIQRLAELFEKIAREFSSQSSTALDLLSSANDMFNQSTTSS